MKLYHPFAVDKDDFDKDTRPVSNPEKVKTFFFQEWI